MNRVVPIRDKILVKCIVEDSKTPGGIIIPDSAKKKPLRGKIIAIGSGKINDKGIVEPFTVKVGDEVLFDAFSGQEITIEREKYLIMNESNILAVVTDECSSCK